MDENVDAECDDEDSEASRVSGITKRSFLAGSGMLMVGGASAMYLNRHDLRKTIGNLMCGVNASSDKKPKQTNSSLIPSTADVQAYRVFLNANPQRCLSANEILRPHFKRRESVYSGVPPRDLWQNIVPTLHVADELRKRLGYPMLEVISAYRSPAYNAKCPGASKYSLHMQNRALDLVFDCSPRKVFDMAERLRKEGCFIGGLGLYNSFIHIDTRGRNATWGV